MEDLVYMFICWFTGIITGIGLGTAITRQRMEPLLHRALYDDNGGV